MKKNIIVLTLITIISGFLLGGVFEITKQPIAEAKENAKQESFREIFSEATDFVSVEGFDSTVATSELTTLGFEGIELLEAVEAIKDGEKLGYVLSINTSEGYAGDIGFVMGVTLEGAITGISFLSIGETAGLGMNATDPAFKDQFKDQTASELTVTKSGDGGDGMIDSISGATITSEAITNGVNAGISYFQNVLGGTGNE